MSSLIVAIDGPAGVGKSTVARRLAQRLGVPMLDTGAMYRAVALEVLDRGLDPDDVTAAEAVGAEIDLDVQLGPDGTIEIFSGGRPVGQRIRTPEISAAASRVSRHRGVRRRLVELQRQIAARLGAVVEGRDIGSVVFPDTPHKFFLTARPEVRAERRWRELTAAGKVVTLEQVLAGMRERDERDQSREESPLRLDDSYQIVDTSDIAIDEAIDRMASAVAARSA